MTAAETRTEYDTRLARYEALLRELGPTGYIHYMQQMSPGRGDYTAERHELLAGITLADIMAELERMRAAGGDQPNLDAPRS